MSGMTSSTIETVKAEVLDTVELPEEAALLDFDPNQDIKIEYRPSPVLNLFHHSDAHVRVLMGPIGSGKTTACVMEILWLASKMKPDKDKKRRSRWAVIRNTYGELKSTTITSWSRWATTAHTVYDAPIRSEVRMKLDDGTTVELEVYFISMDRPQDVGKVLSMELTGVWFNEAKQIDQKVIEAALGRIGRYPWLRDFEMSIAPSIIQEIRHRDTTDSRRLELLNSLGFRFCAIADTNMPFNGHHLYKKAEEERPKGWEFFKQPGALIAIKSRDGTTRYFNNPAAENVEHHILGYTYWTQLVSSNSEDWIKVFILAQYGQVFSGRPVYEPYWDAKRHVSAEPLEVYAGLPLWIGWDFKLWPACAICQYTGTGQVRVLRSASMEGAGLRQFLQMCVQPILSEPSIASAIRCSGIRSIGDPSDEKASSDNTLSCIKMLNDLGYNCKKAITNDFPIRRQSVIDQLTMAIGDKPGIIVDPSCEHLIEGFNGGYQFSRLPTDDGSIKVKDMPNKDGYSHDHDALQYVLLGIKEGLIQMQKQQAKAALPPQRDTWGGVM